MFRIGVDVGGTNTDGVILDLSPGVANPIIAAAKSPTTKDVNLGIENTISAVLGKSQADRKQIQAVCIGTTHFVNALIQRSEANLARVAVIRLCGPFTRDCPPFSGFPYAIREILEGPVFMVEGGLQLDGTLISEVQEKEIVNACAKIKSEGIQCVAVCGVFSPIDFTLRQEQTVAQIIKRELPDVLVTCSSDIANLGLLERENATILNTSLLPFAAITVEGFSNAAKSLELECPIFVTSNDGTLLTLEQAAAAPIRTFSSGPTNSMRGASFLSTLGGEARGSKSVLVMDIGGTTTEIGVLLPSGFPRQAAARHELCGIPLSFSMPHVTSFGIGGGSHVHENGTVGPSSVGYKITTMGLAFGGDTCTATDVALADRPYDGLDRTRVSHLDPGLVSKALAYIKSKMELHVDMMKTSTDDIDLYLVGGGAFLCSDELVGIGKVHRLQHAGCANAVGAAIAQVAGEVDDVRTLAGGIAAERQQVEALAIQRAIAGGADPATVRIIESEAIPVAYTAGLCRFYAKAAGEWNVGGQTASDLRPPKVAHMVNTNQRVDTGKKDVDLTIDLVNEYKPNVKDGVWTMSELDLSFIAIGTYSLGCGGGGDPSHCYLSGREYIRRGEQIRVVKLDSLQPSDMIPWGGFLGSPNVTEERLFGNEHIESLHALLDLIKMPLTDVKALLALEIGGANGMINFLTGSTAGVNKPIVDGDFMGRAYPVAWQTTPNVFCDDDRGGNIVPCSLSSGDGNTMFMTTAKRSRDIDAALRAALTEMGSLAGFTARPLTAEYCQRAMIKNTISLAWRIGRAVTQVNLQPSLGDVGNIVVDALGGSASAKVLFRGKITDVDRRVYKGHTVGSVVMIPLVSSEQDQEGTSSSGVLTIPFKNENLYAELEENGQTRLLAAVPDLIMVLDAQSGKALGTPDYKYGVRVIVIGATAAPQWTDTRRGLALGDLSSFGITDKGSYVPIGKYAEPKSVIDEYEGSASL